MFRISGITAIVLLLALAGCGNGGLENPEDYLLELSDLPTGWAAGSAFDDDSQIDPTVADEEEDDDIQGANISFSQGELGPLLVHAILTSDDSELLDERMELMLESAEEGEPLGDQDVSVREISFPEFLDESYAYRLSTADSIFNAEVNMVIARTDHVVVMVIHLGLGSIDSDETEELVNLAIDKLPE